ncbi:MAG TPA: aldose 1-epimerase family protein [Solirubrobacteraceae bacterium]|jgi:aldose 1-epimerase|nr:aldose 1-epimerase family protein [Solirubrobacteraceae bacterium]
MTLAPSGEQFEIVRGEQRAVIVEVGGGVRAYSVAARPVLQSYPIEEICDGAHGAPLIPWPNRLADGRYRFDGVDHELALSEPAKRNAIHGLLRWRPWQASEREPSRVVMSTRLHPQPGYPFALEVSVAYELGEEGLTVMTDAVNIGERACPYGAGQHPYISPGEGLLDDCLLELPARTRVLTDDERQLPTGREAVEHGELDFRKPRRLGDIRIDSAFTDLTRDAAGRALSRLSRPDGSCVELWVDEHHPFIEVFTGDTLAPSRARRGLAIEPMTCAPNAFQSGDGLIRLEAGQSSRTVWGVRVV